MTRTSSPTVWRRWLAHELRRLRQEAGLSQAEVAKALACHVPKISLIESTERNVQEGDLQKLLALFKVPKTKRPQYFDAVKNARKKGWWEAYGEHTVPQWIELFVGLEQGAERLRTYQTAIFHGLLHTPEYAATILRSSNADAVSEERVDRLVELRTRRQDALWRDADPLHLWTVVDESVLRHIVGSREIMRAQLERVVEVVRKYEHVTLQIIPFDRDGALEANLGPFTILSFPAPNDPGIVYIEHRSSAMFLESLPDIDTHSLVFQQLSDMALSPKDSLKLLRRAADEYAKADRQTY
jgi:transcriptional regulator with XRE-family HTH domain